jgi:hypothetical protein
MASTEGSNMVQHEQRLMDIADEPVRMLPPIQGYEGMPFVTLEEAVSRLEDDIPGIRTYAVEAKKKCSNPPADGLTIDESASIRLYTKEWPKGQKSLYSEMNRVLRDANRENVKKYFRYIKLFITSLCKIPSTQRKLFRGVKLNLSDQYRQGQSIIWWAFSSCTDRIEVLEKPQFCGKTGERTIFEIQCVSTKDVRKHSAFPQECELLLIAATQLKVISSFNAGNGLHTITLKEIEPAYPLIEKPQILPDGKVRWKSDGPDKPPPSTTGQSSSSFVSITTSNSTNADLQRRIGRYQLHAAINLDNLQLTDREMSIVVENAIKEKECTRICLSNNQIKSAGIKLLADGIRESTTIVDLDLSYNGLSDVDVQPLAIELSSHQTDERETFCCFRMNKRVRKH